MLFSSITFLYFFLPVVGILYAMITKCLTGVQYAEKTKKIAWQNLCMLAASLFFYAWGEPGYLFLMLLQLLLVYLFTALMVRFRGRNGEKLCFMLAIVCPLAALGYYKYSGFLYEQLFTGLLGVKGSFSFLQDITLPIGISFYTFQMLSYVIDVHRKRVEPQKNIMYFACYVTFFPQLIAGPIVRYADIEEELGHRQWSVENIAEGLQRFIIGLCKKVLLANNLGEFVQEATALSDRGMLVSWCYGAAVFLQIYFDFSGYSDMAIGLGRIFGFHFPENFRYPIISENIAQFWRRWHITLGSWFRDYVYIPMGGNRVSKGKWVINIFIVWLLTGLWHGAGWNFIVWGLIFGVLLVLEKYAAVWWQGKESSSFILKVIQHGYVVLVIIISFLIFHAPDMEGAWEDIVSLWTPWNIGGDREARYILKNRIVLLLIAIVGATPIPKMCWSWIGRSRAIQQVATAMEIVLLILGLLLCTAYLIDGSFNPFLYFRF